MFRAPDSIAWVKSMWPFRSESKPRQEIRANSITFEDGYAIVDVRGQTCPGYLLAINKAVDSLPADSRVKLLISYPPCGDDVGHWAHSKGVEFVGMQCEEGLWKIELRK